MCRCDDLYFYSQMTRFSSSCNSNSKDLYTIHELIYNLNLHCPFEVKLFENFTCSISFEELPMPLTLITNNYTIRIETMAPNNVLELRNLTGSNMNFSTVFYQPGYSQIRARGIYQPSFQSSRIISVKDTGKVTWACYTLSSVFFTLNSYRKNHDHLQCKFVDPSWSCMQNRHISAVQICSVLNRPHTERRN